MSTTTANRTRRSSDFPSSNRVALFCRVLSPTRAKSLSKNQARKLIKLAMVGFKELAVIAEINDLRESWDAIHQFVQPYDDEDEDDPYAEEPEEGVLTLAGLDDICWDADDVQCMLYGGDARGAIAEVDRFMSLAFGEEKDAK